MEFKVQLNNLRIAPRKSRQVIDLIRGKNVVQAKSLLDFTIKRAADPLLKLLNSAVAAAEKNHQLKESDLYIAKATVDEGPTLKRMQPESRGRSFPIMKRTSHITLILKEINLVVKPAKKEVKKETTEMKKSKIKDQNGSSKSKNKKSVKIIKS
ncbi:MAG: 50S ribosomal protein L22 [Candidatus Staskawiczbacteria bacterium RIFCSPHIGHO2_02_FULL_34_9]|uniref:Large ribosomal subunit protein uL22 n=1 Tax=Candidatus Staskawiczbacteria bacterium RIFCSPHIGHO2_02_FULL_34_9 TaxID=1802206 RepID=A0A1G2HYQ1_9BACT|nr:MAG: 50S ribosomal protein L22 [Candidatus Staskawiczbacteria bacterium RIFCSPHIGHO2_02_FULL_34_9]